MELKMEASARPCSRGRGAGWGCVCVCVCVCVLGDGIEDGGQR